MGYLGRVHPVDLWVVGFLQREPQATLTSAVAASTAEREAVYGWLLRTKAKNARDKRVRTMLEVEAFSELHRRWRELGFPFDHLVPSLATALGSSGDRPAALAELMGIILNGGQRLPPQRISQLVFGAGTPYEVHLSRPPAITRTVMHPQVAATLKSALAQVVNDGTGRRLKDVLFRSDGSPLNVGGKTGTGDNRLVVVRGGQKVKLRALSRTATLVFYLGDNHFGTLTAFVSGDAAKDFTFTSALPAQVLKSMVPVLQPYLQQGEPLSGRQNPAAPQDPALLWQID
jgi:membrane peptidoglycan carboxypeptidase